MVSLLNHSSPDESLLYMHDPWLVSKALMHGDEPLRTWFDLLALTPRAFFAYLVRGVEIEVKMFIFSLICFLLCFK